MDKKFKPGINIGSSSVLVAFVLLAIVTFAALTLLSANSDYKLSSEYAKRNTEYYSANKRAEIYLANVEGILSKKLKTCSNADEFYSAIPALFSDNDSITVSTNNEINISYSVPINDKQNLYVTLLVQYPAKPDDTIITIKRWNTNIS